LRLAHRRRADHRGLLPGDLAVEADATLALERHHARIGDPDPDHADEQLARQRSIEPVERGLVDRRAVLAQQLVQTARLGLVVPVEVPIDRARDRVSWSYVSHDGQWYA